MSSAASDPKKQESALAFELVQKASAQYAVYLDIVKLGEIAALSTGSQQTGFKPREPWTRPMGMVITGRTR